MAKPVKMTERQRRFARAYIKTGNASEAARISGYKGDYAHLAGQWMMSRPHVKSYIQAQLQKVEEAEAIDVPRFIKTELLEVAQEPSTLVDEVSGETSSRRTYKLNTNKMKALELLAKINGLQTERPVQVDLTINMTDEQKAIIEKHGLAKRTE